MSDTSYTEAALAIRLMDYSLLETLISEGLDVNAAHQGESLLHHAVNHGVTRAVELLLAAGANINIRNNIGLPPIFWSVSNILVAKILIDSGADLSIRNSKGQTILHQAVDMPSLVLAYLLLEAGADPNAVDDEGSSPFMEVLEFGPDCVLKFINHGANVTEECLKPGIGSEVREILTLCLDHQRLDQASMNFPLSRTRSRSTF